jgi:short-subunit dehydrogenase
MKPETILITGATGTVGSALAAAYAEPGRTLLLQGRNATRLGEVARACGLRQAVTETKALDVQDVSALVAWLEDVSSRHAVDLAIVNAGAISTTHPGRECEVWQDAKGVLDVNVHAAIATVATLLPHMVRRGSGQIALVSSLLAWFGMPVAPAYSASKAALKAYGEALRRPLAAKGIRINVVLPGFIRSPMSDRLPVPKPFMIGAADAARRIQAGLEKNQARISFPFPLNLGCWLLSACPPALSQRMLALLGFAGTR